MRCVPNMVIMAPANENECRQMLTTGFEYQGPAAVRYPRGKGPGVLPETSLEALPLGKGEVLRQGQGIAILAFGSMVEATQKLAEKMNATLVNMRFIKPLDEALIEEMAAAHELLVTVEENAVAGGAGSGINEHLAASGILQHVLNIGLKDNYIEHGSREECLALAGLDESGIERQITDHLPRIGLKMPLREATA
jgi:1-deoxy-D-xylulose-5-phosphate synthase